MKRWMIILTAIIILLIILILVFNNYDGAPHVSNYSQMDTQMRKLWY